MKEMSENTSKLHSVKSSDSNGVLKVDWSAWIDTEAMNYQCEIKLVKQEKDND